MPIPVTFDNFQVDSENFFIIEPVLLTTAEQTIINSTLNLKLYGLMINNKSGSSATITVTDGNGSEIMTESACAANTVIFVNTAPGYYMQNGFKALASANDALIIRIVAKRA